MLETRHKRYLPWASVLFASLLFLFPSLVFSQPAPSDPLEEVLARIHSIEERIGQIEAGQKEIFVRDEKIHAKLSEVRVWSSRRQRLVSQS